jgi:hypothetical protein
MMHKTLIHLALLKFAPISNGPAILSSSILDVFCPLGDARRFQGPSTQALGGVP